MGRAIRKVPPTWEHPKDEQGHFIPLLTHFPYNEDEIAEGLEDGWLDADKPNYGCDLMPQWTDGEATHLQLYETTTEGTPISPIFESLDELCEWAAENATTFSTAKTSAEQWKRMLVEGFVYHREGNVIFT